MKKKICFRADAGVQTGYGHFIRTLALADMLKDDFDCVFYTVDPSPYQLQELQKVCPCVTLKAETRLEDFLDCLEGTETVVLDNYFYTSDYQQAIKARGCRLVCIDDMHDRHYYADIVINHAYGSRLKDYSTEPYTQVCLGLPYALLRKPFLETGRQEEKRNSILICFGGVDACNLTCKTLHSLEHELNGYQVEIIVGNAFMYKEELVQLAANHSNYKIHTDLNAEDMAGVMNRSHVAVLSASSVLWEAIFSGCHVIYGYYVDNQMDICRNVGTNETLGITCIGDLRTVSEQSMHESFKRISAEGGRPVFRKPDVKSRYLQLFRSEVTVREARKEDAMLYFEWANDPVVRQMAFHTEHIPWEDHRAWFGRKIDAADSLLLLCYKDGQPVGQVRFDLTDRQEAEIDISVAQEHRGKGIGEAMLDAAMAYAQDTKGYDCFIAEVKNENISSRRMFSAEGFKQTGITGGISHFKKIVHNGFDSQTL